MKLLQGNSILVVDDEPALREILKEELEYLGANVNEAANGHEAFELVRKTSFDAVISDIRMPGGDGVELLTRIRQGHPTMPVVMLITGFADITVEEAYAKGAAAVLSKPFDLGTLTKELVRLIQKAD